MSSGRGTLTATGANSENKSSKPSINYKTLDIKTLEKMSGGLFSDGDPEAQLELAIRHISSDPKKYVTYLKKAAEQNHPKAQIRLGICYFSDSADKYGISRSLSKSFSWIKKSADQNDEDGLKNYYDILAGRHEDFEKEIKPDYPKVISFCETILKKNISNQPKLLGNTLELYGWCHLNGRGVKKDITVAFDSFLKARNLECITERKFGFVWGYRGYVGIYTGREKSADETGNYMCPPSGDQGSSWTEFNPSEKQKEELDGLCYDIKANNYGNLGCYYLKLVEEQDQGGLGSKAVEYLLKALQTDGEAAYQLYRCYSLGLAGAGRDPNKAHQFLNRASENKHVEATFKLAMYYDGLHIDSNKIEHLYRAVECCNLIINQKYEAKKYCEQKIRMYPSVKKHLLEIRANQDNADAQLEYGLLCLEEKENTVTGVDWLKKAAKNKAEANLALGNCFANGVGVPAVDIKQAISQYRIAASKGNIDGKNALTEIYRKEILNTLKLDKKTQELDLRYTQFEDKDLIALSVILTENTTLVRVDLQYTAVTKNGAEKLAKAIESRSIGIEIQYNGGSAIVIPSIQSQPSASLVPMRGSQGSISKDPASFAISSVIQYNDISFGNKLGQGGFGTVYKGEWRKTPVAVKVLTNQLQGDNIKEFEHEAKIMTKLQSAYLVRLYGVCLDTKYCLVMEYMPGGSLYDLLRKNKSLDWTIRYQMASDIACGLLFLHQEDMTHRDLKSLNVLIDKNYRAKLADFGLSKARDHAKTAATKSDAVGTLPWMGPELFSRKPVFTKSSDIYSLGVTFWELASNGKTPFADAENPAMIASWVSQGEREPIPDECPKPMYHLIKRCWETKPEARPTIEEVVVTLEVALKDEQKDILQSGYQNNLQSMGYGK